MPFLLLALRDSIRGLKVYVATVFSGGGGGLEKGDIFEEGLKQEFMIGQANTTNKHNRYQLLYANRSNAIHHCLSPKTYIVWSFKSKYYRGLHLISFKEMQMINRITR